LKTPSQKSSLPDTFPTTRKRKASTPVKRSKAAPSQDGSALNVEASQAFDEKVLDKDSQSVLHEFDLMMQYGPCIGLSRSERWARAEKLGLDPPENVKELLEALEGDASKKGKHEACIWEGRV